MSSGEFAQGLCFYKLVLVFAVGALLGDLVEMLFCRWRMGRWMSRSSFIYGPFSAVWGFGFCIATFLFYQVEESNLLIMFAIGTATGGIYEYLCSVVTEYVLHAKFWDYSKMRFNLNGRINLVYCMFWGIAVILWVKYVFPPIELMIGQISPGTGKLLCDMILLFFIGNAVISALALMRYAQRKEGNAAVTPFMLWLDEHFDDDRIEKRYQNMKICNQNLDGGCNPFLNHRLRF